MEGGHYSTFQKISNFEKFTEDVKAGVESWRTTNSQEGATHFLTGAFAHHVENIDIEDNLEEFKNKLRDAS